MKDNEGEGGGAYELSFPEKGALLERDGGGLNRGFTVTKSGGAVVINVLKSDEL